MDKLTKQQEDLVCKLLHCSYSEEITQFILDTIEKHNWTRNILGSDPSFLTEEQKGLYYNLGGGFKMNEVKEDVEIAVINQKIANILEDQGVTKYLYENEEYLHFDNGCFTAFVRIFGAGLAGIGVIDILPDDDFGRDDLHCPDNFLANLGHGISTLGAHQILTLQTVFYLLSGHTFRDVVQGVFMLFVTLMSCHNGNILLRFLFGEYLSLIKQKAQLLHEGLFALSGAIGKNRLPTACKAEQSRYPPSTMP